MFKVFDKMTGLVTSFFFVLNFLYIKIFVESLSLVN